MRLTIAEKMALSLCVCEIRSKGKHATLDEVFSEIDRTWKRFIPEAQELLEEMYGRELIVRHKRMKAAPTDSGDPR